MTNKLWTFGDADECDITVDVPAATENPPVTLTFEDAEIELTWTQFLQLRGSMNDLHRWVRGEGLSGEGH
ncbi:hypothetical protein GTG23_02605 [Rhodococcus hoagii]|nr:hypothetical protein [Prescottella equi]NKZ63447.1 hypothetical protein [Prescottella equi]